jgi:predicted RNA binding protein YcfA (HicA-like mRNA interferase family)
VTKTPTNLSAIEVVKALEKIGFVVKRQRGSHIVMRRDRPPGRVTVPAHKAIRIGTLRAILHQAGISVEELIALL